MFTGWTRLYTIAAPKRTKSQRGGRSSQKVDGKVEAYRAKVNVSFKYEAQEREISLQG